MKFDVSVLATLRTPLKIAIVFEVFKLSLLVQAFISVISREI